MILPRQPEHEYDVDHRNNLFYIRTNKGAKNFRIVTAPVSDPSEKNWKEFVAHRPAVKIEAISLFADHAVLSEWENGLQQLEVVDFKTDKRHRIKFPEPVYSVAIDLLTANSTRPLSGITTIRSSRRIRFSITT